MKLKQKPATMVGPTILGLWGLMNWLIWGRVTGTVMFTLAVAYWVIAFTVTPKDRPVSRWWLVPGTIIGLAVGFTLAAVTR